MLNEITYEKNKKRAVRRKNNVKKAIRKREITRNVYQKSDWDDWEYYRSLHEYSKGKIHCSCPMCTQKTNRKDEFSSFHRYGGNWTHSDIKKIVGMREQLKEIG